MSTIGFHHLGWLHIVGVGAAATCLDCHLATLGRTDTIVISCGNIKFHNLKCAANGLHGDTHSTAHSDFFHILDNLLTDRETCTIQVTPYSCFVLTLCHKIKINRAPHHHLTLFGIIEIVAAVAIIKRLVFKTWSINLEVVINLCCWRDALCSHRSVADGIAICLQRRCYGVVLHCIVVEIERLRRNSSPFAVFVFYTHIQGVQAIRQTAKIFFGNGHITLVANKIFCLLAVEIGVNPILICHCLGIIGCMNIRQTTNQC